MLSEREVHPFPSTQKAPFLNSVRIAFASVKGEFHEHFCKFPWPIATQQAQHIDTRVRVIQSSAQHTMQESLRCR